MKLEHTPTASGPAIISTTRQVADSAKVAMLLMFVEDMERYDLKS